MHCSIVRSYKNNRKISCPNLKEDNIENFVNKCKIINLRKENKKLKKNFMQYTLR